MSKLRTKNYKPNSVFLGESYLRAVEELGTEDEGILVDGWPRFNEVTGGFRMKEFTVFCGPSGAGKTQFLANLSMSLVDAKKGEVPQFIMSIETGDTDYSKRMMSVKARRDFNRGGPISYEALSRFHTNHGSVFTRSKTRMALYDNRIRLPLLLDELQYHREVFGCKIAMIDNFNFMTEVVAQSRAIEEMDRVLHEIIAFTKANDIHIFMVFHPRKTPDERVWSKYDVKGSSTAVQEAQNVLLFNRSLPKEIEEGKRSRTDREIFIDKMRRRGFYTGTKIFFNCNDGVTYSEDGHD